MTENSATKRPGEEKAKVSPGHRDLVEMMEQLADGRDFPSPSGLLRGVGPENAERCLDGAPYSIADNLAHALRWQEAWLSKFEPARTRDGEKKVDKDDWAPAEPGEYPQLRHRFIEGIDRAAEIAACDDLTDGDRVRLIRIALHGAYHLGQLNLLKRLL